MSGTKTATRLNMEDEWKIAQYCIENRVVVNTTGEILFRVQATVAAREVNAAKLLNGATVNAYHITKSMETYKRICEITKQMPFQTPQDSVREDQLVAELKVKDQEICDLKQRIETQSNGNKEVMIVLHKISQLIPAHVFGMKQR